MVLGQEQEHPAEQCKLGTVAAQELLPCIPASMAGP